MEKQRQESGSGRISPLDISLDPKISLLPEGIVDTLQSPLNIGQKSENCGELTPVVHLKHDATHAEIIAAIRCPNTGITFIKSNEYIQLIVT